MCLQFSIASNRLFNNGCTIYWEGKGVEQETKWNLLLKFQIFFLSLAGKQSTEFLKEEAGKGVNVNVLLMMALALWQSLHMLYRLIMAALRWSFKYDGYCQCSHWVFIHSEHWVPLCLLVGPWIFIVFVAWKIALWYVSATSMWWLNRHAK